MHANLHYAENEKKKEEILHLDQFTISKLTYNDKYARFLKLRIR